jgi:hypothetical protein
MPGDTGFVREGVYKLDQTTRRSGEISKPIMIKAYNNEQVILEGMGQTTSGGRFRIEHSWYVIEGMEFRNGNMGVIIKGNASNHNIIRNCSLHGHYFTGVYIEDGASCNQIIDCDAYDMYDSGTDGGNADGFAVSGETSTPGPFNKFIGCRAWNNADDGFDVWKSAHPVEIINCYSFKNGTHSGDGNGFKLGINKTDWDKHIVKNCVAWENRQNGFNYNDNVLPQTLYNCTAYNNKRNYKFGDIGGGPAIHYIQNSISAVAAVDDYLLPSIIDSNTNSWNYIDLNAENIVEDNFISTDDFVASGPRNADGSIPESDFLRLKKGSIFIDSGVDVGLPFNGDAPDLGAFESDFSVGIEENSAYSISGIKVENYPNPAKNVMDLKYKLPLGEYNAKVFIYNILGQVVKSFSITNNSGTVNISTKNLPSGTYVYRIRTNSNVSKVKKILLIK